MTYYFGLVKTYSGKYKVCTPPCNSEQLIRDDIAEQSKASGISDYYVAMYNDAEVVK